MGSCRSRGERDEEEPEIQQVCGEAEGCLLWLFSFGSLLHYPHHALSPRLSFTPFDCQDAPERKGRARRRQGRQGRAGRQGGQGGQGGKGRRKAHRDEGALWHVRAPRRQAPGVHEGGQGGREEGHQGEDGGNPEGEAGREGEGEARRQGKDASSTAVLYICLTDGRCSRPTMANRAHHTLCASRAM